MPIAAAIQARRLLHFTYDGFRRTVEPHTYGTDRKGHKALRAYQVGGGSARTTSGVTKLLPVSKPSFDGPIRQFRLKAAHRRKFCLTIVQVTHHARLRSAPSRSRRTRR